jgi:hypothetical protein
MATELDDANPPTPQSYVVIGPDAAALCKSMGATISVTQLRRYTRVNPRRPDVGPVLPNWRLKDLAKVYPGVWGPVLDHLTRFMSKAEDSLLTTPKALGVLVSKPRLRGNRTPGRRGAPPLLSPEQTAEICRRAKGESQVSLAHEFHVSASLVNKIIKKGRESGNIVKLRP